MKNKRGITIFIIPILITLFLGALFLPFPQRDTVQEVCDGRAEEPCPNYTLFNKWSFGDSLLIRIYNNWLKQTSSEHQRLSSEETDNNNASNWKTYTNEEYGFEFRYPARLSLTEEVPEYSILGEFRITLSSPEVEPKVTFPPNSDPEGIQEFVNNHFLDFISIYKNQKQLALIDFLEDNYSVKSINPSITIFDSIKNDLRKNGGFEESLEYEGYFGGENPQKRVFIKNNEYVYQLTLFGCCDTGAPLSDAGKELFTQILSTFEFTESSESIKSDVEFQLGLSAIFATTDKYVLHVFPPNKNIKAMQISILDPESNRVLAGPFELTEKKSELCKQYLTENETIFETEDIQVDKLPSNYRENNFNNPYNYEIVYYDSSGEQKSVNTQIVPFACESYAT